MINLIKKLYSLLLYFLFIESKTDKLITCLGCGNLSHSVLCKDETFARFLACNGWKAAK